jgi:uncharacterized protein YaiE (UPF0345 family)
MSNSSHSSVENEQVSHNVYFDGAVQSLGLATTAGRATIGVMKKGTYVFSASSPEKMVIISGVLKVKLADSDVQEYIAQEAFDVAAGGSFEVSCDNDVAYLCYYG